MIYSYLFSAFNFLVDYYIYIRGKLTQYKISYNNRNEGNISNECINNANVVFIKKIEVLQNGKLSDKNLKNKINELNTSLLKNESFSVISLLNYIENEMILISDVYIIWTFMDKEYYSIYNKQNNATFKLSSEETFPPMSSDEYTALIDKQKDMFSNGILMATMEDETDITDEIKKYAGPLENFKMYNHNDKFPFEKIILNIGGKHNNDNYEYLFSLTNKITITDNELNDIYITAETTQWIHNKEDCDKHLEDLFKESSLHNVDDNQIKDITSRSSLLDMSFYYGKMIFRYIGKKSGFIEKHYD